MKISDAAIYMTERLTAELKGIITSENHIKTGFMLRTAEVKFLSSTYDGKTRFIFSLKVPSYFSLVEKRRNEQGKQYMLQMLKQSSTFQECLKVFYDAIIQDFGQQVIEQLKNKKEFKNL